MPIDRNSQVGAAIACSELPAAGHQAHPITCPRCLSIDCHSIRIPNLSLLEAARRAWGSHRAGNGSDSIRTLAAFACVEAANAVRDRWSCEYCHHTFR